MTEKVYVVQFEDCDGLSVIGVYANKADARQCILSIIKEEGCRVTHDSGDMISATDKYGCPAWAFYDTMPVK